MKAIATLAIIGKLIFPAHTNWDYGSDAVRVPTSYAVKLSDGNCAPVSLREFRSLHKGEHLRVQMGWTDQEVVIRGVGVNEVDC